MYQRCCWLWVAVIALLGILGSTTGRALACSSAAECGTDVQTVCYTLTYYCVDGYSSSTCSSSFTVKPAGTGCESDGNPCTVDQCNGQASASACQHNAIANAYVCGGSCIPNGTCCNNGSCGGGKVCTGVGGSCVCPGGTYDCGGSCIPNGTCCNNGSCGGGKVCTGVGGSCVCPGGTYDCGGTCVANGSCCNNPNNCSAPANGSSTCPSAGGTCQMSCNGGYKQCGSSCIPSSMCCGGCTSPPNGCYNSAGTCTSGTCSYAYNDGAACNADNDKCTPNDSCMSGTCVADTAHRVSCVQRDCRTAPSCDKNTGNCVDSNLSNGTACGGNGCVPAGTCTSGACSTASQTIDCSGLNTDCTAGLCDPAKPGTGTQKCGTTNVPNGTACSLTDRCMLGPACSGGTCVGTPRACAPSGACRVAACNSTTGGCEETVASVGTSCVIAGGCTQNGTCNNTGDCVGDPVPDGTPCDRANCSTAATCTGGACTCLDTPDLGAGGGNSGGAADHGCAIATAQARDPAPLALLFLAFLFIARRRPVRCSVRGGASISRRSRRWIGA